MRLRSAVVALLVLGATAALPGIAIAQSAIAGVVRDTSGAVLPGVTVEASSPALIEKTKSGTTNEAGQYRIVDLRPGVYTVSFKLAGFNTVVRESIELEANFTAPINVEMRIGSLEESITVTGESPVVDVQTSGRREVVSEELIESLAHRPQLPAPGGHRSGREHRRVRRRRIEHDVDRWQPAHARVADARFADAHRRHGGRCDVRRRPVLVHLRQRGADAGGLRSGVRRIGREPDGRRAG